ncbi:uncharacterized protein LOC119992663 [Tripterygium wilfordii]|uniref:uncharacterized protein LOC119992663 n=1 Tax=Tripterygium wilfordii TaxID=458696 RepID=UPI0018F85E56|nr:uncharacterized protein LOC119992663 [Tripterygium wilfordii]
MGLKTIIFALVLILLLAFQTRAARRFNFYKVAFRWPKSFLNTAKSVQRGGSGHKPILSNFTIHGLFPMYLVNEVVPPYDEDSGCTESEPKDPDFITIELFDEYDLLTDMKTYWPDVVYYRNMTSNLPNIKPNNEKYNQTVIGNVATDYVKRKVEISCNTDSEGNRQLDEIMVCYTTNGNERSCPYGFSYCGDKDEFIQFPSAAAAAA